MSNSTIKGNKKRMDEEEQDIYHTARSLANNNAYDDDSHRRIYNSTVRRHEDDIFDLQDDLGKQEADEENKKKARYGALKSLLGK